MNIYTSFNNQNRIRNSSQNAAFVDDILSIFHLQGKLHYDNKQQMKEYGRAKTYH